MKFSLVTIAYVFALLAAGMAMSGGVGLFIALAVLTFWAWAFYAPSNSAAGCAAAGFIVYVIVASIAPLVHLSSQGAHRAMCMNNLKQIALGLLVYEEAQGQFPRAATTDQTGQTLHSWRTAILPFMDQQALHSQIAMDQPWDSSINRGYTIDIHVGTYECPAHGKATATGHYLAVVGERTMWPPGRGRSISEVRDGTANTVIVIEAPWVGGAWAEPKDFTFDEAVEYLTRKPAASQTPHVVRRGFFYKPQPVVYAAFVDGHVSALPVPLPRNVAVSLLTVDGGELIDKAALDVNRTAELDYGRCYAFGAFVALSLAPAVRLRRKAKSREGTPAAR